MTMTEDAQRRGREVTALSSTRAKAAARASCNPRNKSLAYCVSVLSWTELCRLRAAVAAELLKRDAARLSELAGPPVDILRAATSGEKKRFSRRRNAKWRFKGGGRGEEG